MYELINEETGQVVSTHETWSKAASARAYEGWNLYRVEEVIDSAVKGMSPDQPIVTNEKGGKQSATPYAFHLVPAKALLECAEVLQYGAKRYGAYNWKNIDIEDHINHAAAHLYAHLAGDTSDRHLSHAIVRLMFALELDIEKE